MKISAFIMLLLLSMFAPSASAETKNNINVHTDSQDSNVSVKIDNQINTSNNSQTNSSNNSTHINISQSEGNTEVTINNNDFKISGRVDSTSTNHFTIANQQIIKDNLTSSENSLIMVGNILKVSGIIKSGQLHASDIELVTSNPSATPNPLSSSTPKPSAIHSSSPNLSSPSPEASTLDNVRVTISGPIEHVSNIIQQIIKFLQNLSS